MYVVMDDFGLHWVIRLSLIAASRGSSSLPCVGFSLPWLLLLQGTGYRAHGPQSCGAGLVALWCVGSPKTRG